MRKIVSILAASLALTSASLAYAEDPFQVHIETGAAIPLGNNLANVFSPGPTLEVKALWSVHPNVSIGPAVNGFFLPRTIAYHDTDGTSVWQVGPVVRFQADHQSTKWPHIYPWLDMSPMLGTNQDLLRPMVNVGVGVDAPLDRFKIFWIGPLVRYSHMFMADNTHSDLNILQAGLSLSFDVPVRVPTETIRVPVVTVKHDVKVVIKEVPVVKQVVAPEPFSFSEKVYFAVNSETLHWESKDKLDEVVRKLNLDKNTKIKVQGNSSSDGPLAFNMKLSQKRLQAVLDYLVKHGVDSKRLVAENEGISRPVASNKTKEGRERNRRVEFMVTFTSSK